MTTINHQVPVSYMIRCRSTTVERCPQLHRVCRNQCSFVPWQRNVMSWLSQIKMQQHSNDCMKLVFLLVTSLLTWCKICDLRAQTLRVNCCVTVQRHKMVEATFTTQHQRDEFLFPLHPRYVERHMHLLYSPVSSFSEPFHSASPLYP